MAEISLRQYLRTVEQHVQNGRYEEAIAHARRVLEHYPRLAAAYRLLGLALVGQARWDEASEVFRRLLSATPDDFVAHQQLSVIYEKLKKPQESLWHLERALDLQPNDQQSVARLRELYTKERGSTLERVPMTTAALAGQYLNNGLNDQAIEVLQQAVARMPERFDLKLMLARAQWQTGQHLEAGETAIEVLQTMPYTLAANRILTELWLENERPADAQRFLSRVEEVDPYLAMRLATGEAPVAEAFKLPELDYQQHVRRALTQQSPDWLQNLTDANHEEEPLDLSSELGDDWMDEIEPAAPSRGRITDNLPDLLEENTDTGGLGGLSDELMARLDAMSDASVNPTEASMPPVPGGPKKTRINPNNVVLTGMLDMSFLEQEEPEPEEEPLEDDDSWLDELTRNDDFTIEASDVNMTNDDWLANLERTAGTTGDRLPTGLTGQLGEFDADDAIEDLDAMLNSLENATPVEAGTPRSSTGLTGILDALESNPLANAVPVIDDDEALRPGTKPRRPGSAQDVDTDSLDWVQEFDQDLAQKNTSPLNPDNLPSSDAEDSLAWLQGAGVEIDESAPSRVHTGMLDFEGEEELTDTGSINPNAWMDALGVEYASTDELADQDAEDGDVDSMAWARGLDMVSNAPTSALSPDALPIVPRGPSTPTPDESDPLDWMSDESLLAEYEAFENLQDDEFEDEGFSDVTFETDPTENDYEPQPIGEISAETSAESLDPDADYAEYANTSDDLTEEELVENADLYAELLDSVETGDDDDNFIPDEFRADALTTDPSIEEGQATMQTPSWPPSDPDDPDQPSMSDDLEWLSDASLSDDLLGDDEYIPDPDADEPITDLDSFFGGPASQPDTVSDLLTDGDDAELNDASWLSEFDLEADAGDETPAVSEAVEPGFDWSIESATDVPSSDSSWLSDLGAEPANTEDEGFDWNTGFVDQTAVSTEEPDWLSDIEDPTLQPSISDLEAEGVDDSALPADAGWLSDLELEDAADAPAGEADEDLIWNTESGFDTETEGVVPADDQMGWLSEASDNVMQDYGVLPTGNDDTTEMEPGGEAWLSELNLSEDDAEAEVEPAADAWLSDLNLDPSDEDAEAEPAAEGWLSDLDLGTSDEDAEAEPAGENWLSDLDLDASDEDAEAEPAAEGWLSDLETPSDDDLIGQPLSTSDAGAWLDSDDTGLDWETLDDAEPSPTAGMTGLLNNIETQRYSTDMLESLEPSSEDEPNWLETVDSIEAVEDAETPSWLAATIETPRETEEPITAGIDWTADTFADDADILDTEFAEPVAEEESFAWENPAFAAENDPDQFGELDEFAYGEDETFDPNNLTTDVPLEGEQAEWLTGIGQSTDESWMEAEPVAEEPSWLSDLDGEEEAAAETPATPEWLSDTGSDPDEEFDFSEENVLEDDESLLPVGETGYFTGTADETFDYSGENPEEFDFSGENVLEDDESRLPVAETGYFTGTADETFDYFEEDPLQEQELLPVSQTEHITSMTDDSDDDDQAWLGAEDDVEEFDWAADRTQEDVSVHPVVIEGLEVEPVGFHAEAQLSDSESVPQDVTDDDLRDYDFDEELEATPAANAPDWLNSMVPGLDLDFEAEEEEAAEEPAPAAALPSAPPRKDFDWLETIVNDETSQRIVPVAPPPPPSLPGVPASPAAQGLGERVRRFVFKDLPSWMRGGTPAATVAPAAAPVESTPDPMMDNFDDFNADMDDDLFDDLDAEFDDFDDSMKK